MRRGAALRCPRAWHRLTSLASPHLSWPAPLQVRELVRGSETVLGDAGADYELFVADAFEEYELVALTGACKAERLQRSWDQSLRVK
jgi:hypothetical protein